MDETKPPSAGMYDFLGWVETNKSRIAIVAAVIAVVALVAGFIAWRSSQQEVDAAHALSSVAMPFSPTELPKPGTAEALVKVADEYPKTSAAPKALLRGAAVFHSQGNFAKAQETFDRVLRDYGDSPWVPQAVFGVAASLEAQGKSAEAIARYEAYLKSYGNTDPAADQARLNLARLYEETKQPAMALDILRRMTEGQMGFNPMANDAQDRIRALLAKNPSLMPTNPVASPNMLQPAPGMPGPITISPTPGAPNPAPSPGPTPAPTPAPAPAPAAPGTGN